MSAAVICAEILVNWKRSMESTIDDYFTISDNAGILEEKRLTGYNRDDIMFFVDGSLAQLVEHLTLNQGVRGSNPWWSTRHSALSHGWLRAFLFLPNSHKIHHFYQIQKMPFRSAWRDGIFWCSVTGCFIFFVRKKYLPVIKVWRYNQSTLAAFCSLLCPKGIKGTRSNVPCAMCKGI